MLMGSKSQKNIPGVAFLVDARGRRKSVLIDLEQHGSLWEDLYDAYVAQQRQAEPRESLAMVKRLIQSPTRRRGRGSLRNYPCPLREQAPAAKLRCSSALRRIR